MWSLERPRQVAYEALQGLGTPVISGGRLQGLPDSQSERKFWSSQPLFLVNGFRPRAEEQGSRRGRVRRRRTGVLRLRGAVCNRRSTKSVTRGQRVIAAKLTSLVCDGIYMLLAGVAASLRG